MLVRWLWFALALLATTAHAGPALSQLQPRLPAAEKIPVRELNLDDTTSETYLSFLEDVRNRLEVCHRGVPGVSDVVTHVLPPQTQRPTAATVDWFDVRLQTGASNLTVRIRSDNLYVMGIRAEGGADSVWRAFQDTASLIPGARRLPSSSSYTDLERQAGQSRTQVTLGLGALRGAVDHFAYHRDDPANDAQSQEQGKAALVLVQMLSEALRFRTVAAHVSAETGVMITQEMKDQENSWESMSAAVLRSEAVYDQRTPLSANDGERDKWRVWTVSAAIAILAVAVQPVPPASASGSAGKREPQCGLTPRGRTLLEVYYVRIHNIDDEDPGDLYGTITVTDWLGTETLWREDWLYSIRPEQDVPLTGPTRPISGNDAFSIDLDLWDRDRLPDPTPDDEVVRDGIQWRPADPSHTYDVTHYQMLSGKYGSASVQYAVLSAAVTATFSVVLIRSDDDDPADVCGTVTVVTKMDRIVLFERACDGSASVSVGVSEDVPLRRSKLAVSLDDGVVTVEAHLWDWNRWSSNAEIANGQGTFAVIEDTKSTIEGKAGVIDVHVEWTAL